MRNNLFSIRNKKKPFFILLLTERYQICRRGGPEVFYLRFIIWSELVNFFIAGIKINMEQKIFSQTRKMNFIFKNLYLILIISVFFLQPTLTAQMKPGSMNASENSKDSVNGITIHQEIDFNASPSRIYEVLSSTQEFSACTKKSFNNFTAMSATIDPVVGGTFTLFDGHIIGRILELVPNQRIVEAWRVVDWPAGIYSIAKFEFISQGSGTKLIFDHVGFPKGLKEHLASGWQEHYWGALTKYLQ
jgi:uncharacterized protein YndB with AHSA1/START domain